MANMFRISPIEMDLPTEVRHLRVAAYCRVSTKQEEQDSSIELQEMYYRRLIEENPNWTNAGIFSERASGLNLKERPAFIKMMGKCRKRQIDLILTKAMSRFGRNTLDMLKALRELRGLGVDVYFERENLWLHDQQLETLIAMLFAFAQAESENMSQNIKWGIKRGFESGTSGYADFVCFGYKRGDDGRLTIDEPDAEVVRRLFEMRASGKSLGTISDWLYEQGIPSPTGRSRWSRETISKLLKNEKYLGEVLLQKTYVKDLFSGKQVKNAGEKNQYLYQEHHPAIISRELFEAVNKTAKRSYNFSDTE